MINKLTQELLNIKQELLRLKTSQKKSAVGLGAAETKITINTPTASSGTYSGHAYILVQGVEPFIVQGYFDDNANFQSDHISFIETLFFLAPGVALLGVRVINTGAAPGTTFTDDMTIVTTSDVVLSVQYEE